MQNSCIFAREDLHGSYAGYEHFQRQNKEKVKNPGDCCAHHTSSEQHSDHGRIINLQRDRVLPTREFLQEPISPVALVDYCPRMDACWDADRQPLPPATRSQSNGLTETRPG